MSILDFKNRTTSWMQTSKLPRYLMNPTAVFIALQAIWISLTILWVIWFTDETQELAKLSQKFGPDYFDETTSLIMLIVGCILLGMFAVGTIALFVFGQRQSRLIRQQRNFVSSVTHELRSPLSSLKLSLETMQKRDLSKEMNDKLLHIASSDIDRLSRLVNQILVSARLDRGLAGFEDHNVKISISNIISQVLEQNLWLDQNLYQRLSVHCDDNIEITSAKAALSLIISNLIENAIKYSKKETPIFITATTNDQYMIFSIKDEGIGIAPNDIKKIFRMFYRSSIASTKAVPGTGLGLFIVKSLAQVLGGKVWVESEGRGFGSTFYLTLPKKQPKGEGN